MNTYTLHFKARGEKIITPIICEVSPGNTSLNYKPIVDEEISIWLRKNKLIASYISILNIMLENDSKQIIFAQGNWIDPTTIIIKDLDKQSNLDPK